MDNESLIHSVEVSNTLSIVLLALAYVIPRSKGNWRGGVVLLNTCPPKSSDDHCNLLYKGLRKKNSGHIIDRDGGKNGLDVS